jgi:hypothetical protein
MDTHIADIVFEGKLEDCALNTFFKNNRNLKRIRFIDCQADRITYEFLKQGKADLSGITMINA